MFLILFLLAFLILLIAISLVNFFLSIAIKLVTNNSIEEYKFILPSILYLVISGLTFLIMYIVTINMLDLNILESAMAIVFKTVDITSKLKSLLLINIVIMIISILIQSLCLLTVNIDYTVTLGKIRMAFKDLTKKKKVASNKTDLNKVENNNEDNKEIEKDTTLENEENIENKDEETISNLAAVVPENEMAENKERLKLSFLSSLICTIFIFSFLFFMFMILFTTGNYIAFKFL